MARMKGDDVMVTSPSVKTDVGLYWFGTIPATGLVDVVVQTVDLQKETGDYFRHEKVRPWDLWNVKTGADDARIWLGKCRYYQSLAVRGFIFPAWTDYVDQSIKEDMEKIRYPGAISPLRQSQVDAIVRSSYHHVLRFPNGADSYMKLGNHPQTVDLDANNKPERMTEEEWLRNKIVPAIRGDFSFDQYEDKYMAEFVYLRRLDADPRKTKREDYYNLVSRLNENFFESPPQSIAETYPQTTD